MAGETANEVHHSRGVQMRKESELVGSTGEHSKEEFVTQIISDAARVGTKAAQKKLENTSQPGNKPEKGEGSRSDAEQEMDSQGELEATLDIWETLSNPTRQVQADSPKPLGGLDGNREYFDALSNLELGLGRREIASAPLDKQVCGLCEVQCPLPGARCKFDDENCVNKPMNIPGDRHGIWELDKGEASHQGQQDRIDEVDALESAIEARSDTHYYQVSQK